MAANPYLLTKTFELTNDIDFGHGTFVPLGTATGMPFPFTGKILGEGYTLSNITLTNSHCGGNLDCGIVRIMGMHDMSGNPPKMASLGRWDSPLYIDNVIFNLDSASMNNVGIIGKLIAGQTTVRVSNAEYYLNTGSSVGGIVGFKPMHGLGRIDESSFQGTITTASGFQNIGGLAGLMLPASGSTTVANSFSDVTFVGDGMNVGGLIGKIDLNAASSTQPMEVRDCYTYFNGIDNHLMVGGLIGEINGSNTDLRTGTLIAHVNTADSMNPVVGSYSNGAAYSGGTPNLYHMGPNTAVIGIAPFGQPITYTSQEAELASDWIYFLNNFAPTVEESHLMFHQDLGATRLYWEFPPGTYDY
jgi:hypothetical protein